jgi:hypothetical protein
VIRARGALGAHGCHEIEQGQDNDTDDEHEQGGGEEGHHHQGSFQQRIATVERVWRGMTTCPSYASVCRLASLE